MPNAYVLNQVPVGYSAAHWLLIQMLVAAGWTIKSSGDGLAAFSATGSVFSNGSASGANGFGQAKAWARLQDPGGVRELLYQHDNAGGLRLKYSPSAKFTGGSPASNVTPSATDEQYLRGAATDATPSYGAAWFESGVLSGFTKFQGAAQAAAPYSFWFAGATTPAGTVKTGICLDGVTGVPEDLDQAIWHIGNVGVFDIPVLSQGYPVNGGTAFGNFGFADVGKTVFRHWNASYCMCGSNSVTNAGLVVNPFNGKNEAIPIVYMRHVSQTNAGLKGWSSQFRWITMARTTFQDTADNRNWICVNSLWLPWDGVTAPTN